MAGHGCYLQAALTGGDAAVIAAALDDIARVKIQDLTLHAFGFPLVVTIVVTF